jgi:hypothetical protein
MTAVVAAASGAERGKLLGLRCRVVSDKKRERMKPMKRNDTIVLSSLAAAAVVAAPVLVDLYDVAQKDECGIARVSRRKAHSVRRRAGMKESESRCWCLRSVGSSPRPGRRLACC